MTIILLLALYVGAAVLIINAIGALIPPLWKQFHRHKVFFSILSFIGFCLYLANLEGKISPLPLAFTFAFGLLDKQNIFSNKVYYRD